MRPGFLPVCTASLLQNKITRPLCRHGRPLWVSGQAEFSSASPHSSALWTTFFVGTSLVLHHTTLRDPPNAMASYCQPPSVLALLCMALKCWWFPTYYTIVQQHLLTRCYRVARQIRSDKISRSVVSDSLRPHESQHARPPCPSPTPGVHWESIESVKRYTMHLKA